MALIEKKHAVILMFAVLMLGILVFGAQGPDTARNALITQSLRDLKAFDATLKQQLLQIYGGTLWQFDTLVALRNQIRKTSAELSKNIRIYDLGGDIEDNPAKPYLGLVAEQSNLVEDFTSDIAIWRNSLALLELTENLETQLVATQAESALLRELVGFRAGILQFIVNPSENAVTRIEILVVNIRSYLAGYPPETSQQFDTIVKHVETLVTYGRRLTQALAQVMALPAQEHLDDIEKNYSVFYNDRINTTNIFTILMFVCGALLLMYITYLLIRLGRASTSLRNANVLLEARVEDRTRALRDALHATESANNAKSAFVTNMNHELRTPLNHIIGYSEMLNEDAADLDRDEVELFASRIATSGRHLLQLVNKVMDLSQIEAGHVDLDITQFSVAEVVDDVSVLAEGLAEQRSNRFKSHKADGLGEMNSDETRIRQILVNLLGNAAKFTEGGQIILSVERTAGLKSECDVLTFEVTDTGVGMSTEDALRIFEPFARADDEAVENIEGTGIGLSITKRFCELLGGHVRVESEIGRGSTFTVTLPAEVPVATPDPEMGGPESDAPETANA